MKKLLIWLMAACLILSAASAEETFDGVVIAGNAVTVTAPYGGTVDNVYVKQGQLLTENSEILSMATTRVLATEDGTIHGIFAQAGEDASGTVMYLSPVSRYTIRASISKAASTAQARYVTLGETVYLRCTKDGSHEARGIVTGVDGTSYTVQTTAGELYMEETVYLYRSADYDADECIGSGTVSRTEAIAIRGSGSVLRLHVQDGEDVERGQLLFETVEGVIDGAILQDASVRTSQGGVVAEVKVQAGQKVSQGDVLLTLYQPEDDQIRFSIPEDMLSSVSVGDDATITFNWKDEQGEPVHGTVTEISYIGTTGQNGETTYDGYIAFSADESVRLGMNVTVTLD